MQKLLQLLKSHRAKDPSLDPDTTTSVAYKQVTGTQIRKCSTSVF